MEPIFLKDVTVYYTLWTQHLGTWTSITAVGLFKVQTIPQIMTTICSAAGSYELPLVTEYTWQ